MLGLLGGVASQAFGGFLGMKGQEDANEANKDIAQHGYSWASRDMKRAGLNPMMMFGHGGPAPPGAPQQNVMAAPAAALKDAASSASQMLVANKTIENLTSQIAKQNAEKANINAALPGIAADADLKALEFGDVKKIPPAVRVPIVQSGYGINKFRGTGNVPMLGAGAISSGKSASGAVRDALSPLVGGLSGPSLSSARGAARELKRKYDELPSFTEAEREAARLRNAKRWGWLTGKKARGSVQYQQ